MSEIYKGDVGVRITITTNNTALSVSDTLSLKIVKPTGATAEWALVSGDLNTTTGVITYYSKAGDLSEAGQYLVQIKRLTSDLKLTHSDVDNLKVLETLW
jgi:hypothetical protein